jgi:hypothetical protein
MVGTKDLHCLFENFLELKVDGPGGSMIVDIRIKVEAGIEEHGQSIEPSLVQKESLPTKGGIVKEPPPVDGTDGDTRHIRVSQNIIDIVEGEDPSKELLEEMKPSRMLFHPFFQRSLDEKGNVFWTKDLSLFKVTQRTSPDPLKDGGQSLPDDMLPNLFMVGLESGEVLFVKEMAEGTMPHIV